MVRSGSAMGEAVEKTKTTLARVLGFADGTAIVIGTIIGSGIFLVPGSVAAQLNSPAAVLLVWLTGGVLSLFGALSLAELGAAFPGAGGLYVYLRQAFGRPAGFLYGWGLLSMIHSGSIATLAVAFGLYLGQVFPLGTAQQKAIGIGCVLLLTGINCLGIRAGKLVQNLFTVAKLGGLATMTLLLFSRGQPADLLVGNFWPQEMGSVPWMAFGVALVAVLWAYEGWHVVSFAAGEFKRPTRDLPRSLLTGTLVILVSYLLANAAYYSVLTDSEIGQGDTVAAVAMSRVFGSGATALISLLILVSIFGAMNGMVLTGPRVYYAMAREGLFFRAFARLSPRYQTPTVAIVAQGIWASVLATLGSFQQLFTYVIFTAWIFYGTTVAGVIILRRARPDLERPYRVPGFPWLPLLFSLAALGITISTIVADPLHALLGVALILVGVPLYFLFRRAAPPAEGNAEALD